MIPAFTIFLIGACDLKDPKAVHTDQHMQSVLIKRLMHRFVPEDYGWKKGNNFDGDVCDWKGSLIHHKGMQYTLYSRCTDGVVHRLNMKNLQADLQPQYLPSTLTNLIMVKSCLPCLFDVRWLPRPLTYADINGNSFFGTISCDSFPVQLEKLLASENAFSGSIELTSLPRTLKVIDLSNNKIKQKVLVYANLPEGIRINLCKNNIRRIYPIDGIQRPHAFYGV